jgi:maltose O-acetyltransferase
MRSEKEKMLAGELYDASDLELQAELAATHRWLVRYNAALAASASERRELLLERFAQVGAGAVIRPPFHCDYGFNISLGAGVFLNFNCVILDVVAVSIGEKTQIGPAVQILAGRSPARCGSARRRFGVWSSDPHRVQCLDRRRRHHPAGSQYRRRCADWRG